MKKYLAALFLLASLTGYAQAEPIAVLSAKGVTVTLRTSPCSIKYVTNLPLRATWQEGEKVFEGCYALFPESEALGFWFDDGSVAVIPVRLFKAATGI